VTTSANPRQDPLSQVLSQFLRVWNYRPVTSWDDFFNPQFVINANSGDAAVENDVLAQVGSYGKQLGVIIDALSLVISTIAFNRLLPSERQVLDRFETLRDQVNKVVAQHQPLADRTLTTADVTDFLSRLQVLGHDDPAAAQTIGEQLTDAVRGLGDATPT
jgi:hypothetical protein